jgi:hypothetical protein
VSETGVTPSAAQATVDPQWYIKIWTLDIRDMSWTERTAGSQALSLADFTWEAETSRTIYKGARSMSFAVEGFF